ncbi:polyamine-modulated factor 1 isoform X2 [Andrena cerasifolii]|uniref:polyamine-modulated factor 1 isoform X2 n=1 Tax=Andrena cerasifolii TaxID=2819439 RepID=UPI004037E13B
MEEDQAEDAFLDILPMLKQKPNVARKLHKALSRALDDSMNEELEDILNEGSLEPLLEKVSKLSDADSSVHENAWRPPGNVNLHMRSLDAQRIKDETEQLAKRVDEMEAENAALIGEITQKRSKISALHDSITRSLNKSPVAIDLLEKRLEHLEKCLKLLDHE